MGDPTHLTRPKLQDIIENLSATERQSYLPCDNGCNYGGLGCAKGQGRAPWERQTSEGGSSAQNTVGGTFGTHEGCTKVSEGKQTNRPKSYRRAHAKGLFKRSRAKEAVVPRKLARL